MTQDIINIQHRRDFDPAKLKKWITEQTKLLVKETKNKYPQLGPPTRVTINDTSRWGYTRRNGVIILNWQLSTIPRETAEYIIVHELFILNILIMGTGFMVN